MLRDFLTNCPGVAGQIARAIDSCLPRSEPHISLAAGLSFMGFAKCGLFHTSDGFHPNIFAMIIADTGSGKTIAFNCIRDIMSKVGLNSCIIREPESSAGYLGNIRNSPKGIMLWDECGIALKELSDTKTGHRALILKDAMNLYTSPGRFFQGRSYSPNGKSMPIDIDAPYANILGATQPNRYFQAINLDFILDGLLGRWHCYHADSSEPLRDALPPRFQGGFFVDQITPLLKERKLAGNLGIVEPLVIDANPRRGRPGDIWKYFQDLREGYKDEISRAFFVRAFEHYSKIFLAIADAPDTDTINERNFAIDLVQYLIGQQIIAIENNLGLDKRHEASKARVVAAIGVNGASHSTILRSCRTIKGKVLKDILEELLDSDSITSEPTPNRRGRKSLTYFLSK